MVRFGIQRLTSGWRQAETTTPDAAPLTALAMRERSLGAPTRSVDTTIEAVASRMVGSRIALRGCRPAFRPLPDGPISRHYTTNEVRQAKGEFCLK